MCYLLHCPKQGASDFGRASKAAARHLRALVYLTRGYQDYADVNDFKNAYDDAMYVIERRGIVYLKTMLWFTVSLMRLMMRLFLL